MTQTQDLFPDVETLVEMEPEELAPMLLKCLSAKGPDYWSLRNLMLLDNILPIFGEPARTHHEQIAEQLAVAWNYLETEGLIAPKAGDPNFSVLTKRGKKLAESGDFESAFKSSRTLPKELLHPTIRQKSWPDFVRGEYDSAVFKAFKEVEVAVRDAAGLSRSDIGVRLMRKAFDVNNGPLTDPSAEPGEKQALSDLFAGAIASYKNPNSHRHVAIEAEEAAEMIVLASHLFKIAEDRTSQSVFKESTDV